MKDMSNDPQKCLEARFNISSTRTSKLTATFLTTPAVFFTDHDL